MTSSDRYTSFQELSAHEHEGHDFRRLVHIRSPQLGILAPHGGGIEPGTSELAQLIAGDDLTLYCFEGVRDHENFARLHITSERFDEPLCRQVLAHIAAAVTIHGCQGDTPFVYLGGRAHSLITRLRVAFASCDIPTREEPPFLAQPRRNICNQGRSGRGVQLEFSRSLRRHLFGRLRYPHRVITPHCQAMVVALRFALIAPSDDE